MPETLPTARLLRQFGIHPNKRLGQNFLVDETALQKITAIAEIQPAETVLEIGPGLGNLTRHLAEAANRVVAVEIDKRFIPVLKTTLAAYDNIHLVEGDILALNPAELISNTPYLVVANIPYYITSPLLRHLLENQYPPTRMILTIQHEVATRICASPGELSLLALSVQVFGSPSILLRLPAGAFYPPPKVDSAVVRVDLYTHPVIPAAELNQFFRLAKAGFSQKRKTLRNALAGGMHWKKTEAESWLLAAGLEPSRRAETLSLEEWSCLARITSRANGTHSG